MTRTSHAAGSHVRRWCVALALGGLSLSVYAGVGRDRATGQAIWDAAVNGRTTNIGTDGGAWKVIGPATTSAGTAAGSAKVAGTATATVDGTKVPVNIASGDITKQTIANVVFGCATGGYVGCALGIAVPLATAYFSLSGARVAPDGSLEMKDPKVCSVAPCLNYRFSWGGWVGTWAPTQLDACAAYADVRNVNDPTWVLSSPVVINNGLGCNFSMRNKGTGAVVTSGQSTGMANQSVPPQSPTWYPSTPQAVKDAMYVNNPPVGIVDELARYGNIIWPGCPGGVCPPGSSPLAPVVTGPASIQKGSTTVRTNPDGSTVTTTTSQTLTYSGPNVIGGPITETEIARNPSGVTTGTTSTVKTPDAAEPTGDGAIPPKEEKEDPPVQCDKYPNSLGCSELDTPGGEIPKETKTLSYTAENPFGGGSCPADRMFTSYMTGRTFKAWDFAQTCSYIATYVRPLVLLLATFAAFLIIMPGKVET